MMGQVFLGIAVLIHLYIFVMESVLWGKPRINKVFGITPEQAEHCRLFALNQGYYNLFLSIAGMIGIGIATKEQLLVGMTLMIYAAASMFGASVVLFCTNRRLARPALIQGLPPFLSLCSFVFPHLY